MNKRLKAGIIAVIACLSISPLYAQSEVKLTSNVEHIKEGESFETQDEAPGLKITIKDAYKQAGKTEKVILKLEDAVWAKIDGVRNGTNVAIYDTKNIDSYKISLMGIGEDSLQLNVDIPADIKEGDEVSFVVALMVEVTAETASVTVEPGKDSKLIETKKVLIGAQSSKQVTWEVGDVPTIVKEGKLAPITFEEVRPYSIADEVELTLKLQNSNLAFGDFDYISEKVHADDTDYELDADDYVTYGGGFEGMSDIVKLKKINGNDQTLIFKIKGGNTAEAGKITLKNIPIINKAANFKEEDVLLTLEGDAIVDAKKDITVAYVRNKTTEEEKAEEEAEIEAIAAEEEKKNADKEAQRGAHFKVGESSYTVDGTKYDMDAATFIQEPGYIMVPLKYVALALGAYEEDIQYNNGMIYFKCGNRNVELRVNSNMATVNNNGIEMETPVVIKNGRSYAPIGEVARLLGLSKEWNNAEKTASFKFQ